LNWRCRWLLRSFQRASHSIVRLSNNNRHAWHSRWVEKLRSSLRQRLLSFPLACHSTPLGRCSSMRAWHNTLAQPMRRCQHHQQGPAKRQTKQQRIQSLTFWKLQDWWRSRNRHAPIWKQKHLHFWIGLASLVEAEATAKSEDECANQSESWDEPMTPTARVRPTPSSSQSVRSRYDPSREATDRRWKFSGATRLSSRTMPSRGIRAKDHCHSSRARPAAVGSTHEGKASRRLILLERPAWTPTAPRLLQKQQTIERQGWCDDGSWRTVPRAFEGLPLRESLL
jgi:hypothetical protein